MSYMGRLYLELVEQYGQSRADYLVQTTPLADLARLVGAEQPQVPDKEKSMPEITNDNGLLLQDGELLGYLIDFKQHGVFSPSGRVDVDSDDIDTHNHLLDEMYIRGLDERCEIGQGASFYLCGQEVQTFTGRLVSDDVTISTGPKQQYQTITFRRNSKVFQGRAQSDADVFNFRRIK